MAEWLNTSDPQYWLHTDCGERVKVRFGLPDRYHKCGEAMRDYGRDNACYECGAITHPDHYGQHSNFHANFIHRSEVKDGFAVSAVKWCDAGNHAFKANAPGSQSLDVTQRGDDGKEERVTMDMCASHAFPTAPQTDTLRQVEKSYEQERLALDSRQYAPTDQPVWGGSEYPAT